MVTISKLEIENVKRVKAVKIEPSSSGLTIVGGRIVKENERSGRPCLGLGGNKYRPSQAPREGSVVPRHIVHPMALIVERKGKNSDLKVIDPNGQKGGQHSR